MNAAVNDLNHVRLICAFSEKLEINVGSCSQIQSYNPSSLTLIQVNMYQLSSEELISADDTSTTGYWKELHIAYVQPVCA